MGTAHRITTPFMTAANGAETNSMLNQACHSAISLQAAFADINIAKG